MEHRAVAEEMIGRSLRSDEAVHHINGDKLDNQEENLLVMTRSEHRRLENRLADEFKREKFSVGDPKSKFLDMFPEYVGG